MNNLDPLQWKESKFGATSPSVVLYPGYYIQVLSFSSVASIPLVVSGRIVNDANRLVETGNYFITTNSARTANGVTLPVHAGLLYSLAVKVVSGAVSRGQIFIRAILWNGDPAVASYYPLQILFSDYVTSNILIGYPFTGIQESTSGIGFTKIYGATALGNAVQTNAVPVNTRWQIIEALNTLTTGVTVGTRRPLITFTDVNGFIEFQSLAAVTEAASLAYNYFWSNVPALTLDANNNVTTSFPPNIFAVATESVAFSVLNGAAGDSQQTALRVSEWLDV